MDERWMDRGIGRKGSEQQPANNIMGRKDGRGSTYDRCYIECSPIMKYKHQRQQINHIERKIWHKHATQNSNVYKLTSVMGEIENSSKQIKI
ncbi:hypothetical protein FC756_02910 [Lysinibacillus mangiferihumi]|uniref:Uncharacterized protein n=2 Tax=Lysinibacillus mangiferihumi TaxID=1130819 RepID=A0A4U2ZF44_9BACI|nr:hypothetical protein FC756_02910 [Lysinibacillus mangiferihumi]